MSGVERIRDRFRRAFDGAAWHGPSVLAHAGQIAILKKALGL